jgi:pilus assembly protein CpaE
MLDAVPYLRNIDQELIGNIVVEHATGVHLVLAPPSPQEAEVVTPDLVKGLLTVIQEMYDVVVVDTRPSFDELNLALFDAADVLLLVVTMDMTAIKDARQFIEVTDLLGYPSDRVRLVLNRTNTYSGIPEKEIGDSLRRPVWASIPEELGPVTRSINEGVPLVSTSSDTRVAHEVNRMAREILTDTGAESIALLGDGRQQRGGLIGRFREKLRTE